MQHKSHVASPAQLAATSSQQQLLRTLRDNHNLALDIAKMQLNAVTCIAVQTMLASLYTKTQTLCVVRGVVLLLMEEV